MPGNDALAFTTAVNTLAAAMARCLDDSELATAHAEELLAVARAEKDAAA